MTTDRRLREDVALAAKYHIEGTPLVLVNGRHGTSYPPFLLAMVLTGGSADDPAFARLPPPRADAHMH
jgi:serine/threonine-protein kinase